MAALFKMLNLRGHFSLQTPGPAYNDKQDEQDKNNTGRRPDASDVGRTMMVVAAVSRCVSAFRGSRCDIGVRENGVCVFHKRIPPWGIVYVLIIWDKLLNRLGIC
jgi:hypothetical protein